MIKAAVSAGQVLKFKKSPEMCFVAKTALHYERGFIELMGLFQEDLSKHKLHLLQDGKLALKSAKRTPFFGAIQHLLRKLSSPNKAMHGIGAFQKYVEAFFSHLQTNEGQALI